MSQGSAGSLAGTWIRAAAPVEVVRLTHAEGGYTAAVDRPAAMRFREPVEVVTVAAAARPTPGRYRVGVGDGGAVAVGVGDGEVVAIDRDGVRTPLRRVLQPWPATLTQWCGWYDADDRTVLLTQFPEEYFGEPMGLIQAGDRVMRAYPVGERSLVREDGEAVDLLADGPQGRPVLRVGAGGVLARSARYHEREVTFPAVDAMLAGTLITPAGPGPHPAAVVVHGAAGGQRDFYRLFAGALLDAGVAALLYDKRGHGRSSGAAGPTIFDQADAVSAAFGLLGGVPGIDPARRGLVGFSNGMWAVPMVAAAHTEVAFVAGVGSPGVPQAESEVHRRTTVLREAGVAAGTLDVVAEAWRCLFGVAASGHASPEQTAHLSTLLARLWSAPDLRDYETPEYVRQNPMLSPVPPAMPVTDLLAMITDEPHPDLAYDPADDYRRLRCPVFLQYGAQDSSVPVAASVERITAALGESARARSAVRVYPDLEHLLNVIPDTVTGIAPEEAMVRFHGFRYGAGVRADLTTWLRTTVGPGA